ncbi:MAG: ABC transporter ATP-binding protein, partial [Pseudomonadota bacterium]
PPMNLVRGHVEGGVFTAPGIRVETPRIEGSRDVTIGFRPEDCHVTSGEGHLNGVVYGVEPTGDITYLTLAAGEALLEIKANREYRAELDTPQAVEFDLHRLYFFDQESGDRIR